MESRSIGLFLTADQIEQLLNFLTSKGILCRVESVHNARNHNRIIEMLIVCWLRPLFLDCLCFRLGMAFLIHQPDPPSEQLLHHALLDLLILGQFLFQLLGFIVHIGKHSGNLLLFLYQRGVF